MLALSIVPALCQAQVKTKEQIYFLAAGVPKVLGEKKNFQEMFEELKGAGITVFMPFSEYQETPESKALDLEREFFPRYKSTDAAINAMQKSGVKLLVPASILYADEKANQKEDPLKTLISWAGRSNVFGVYSVDEPALNGGNSLAHCKSFYARIKKVDPTIPVIMIHSSIPESAASKKEMDSYLERVKESSQFADIVGFDVYAIPQYLMKVKGPYSGADKILDYATAITEYIRWLKENLPNKKHMLVNQAFCAEDQGHPMLLARLYGDRRPNAKELQDMVRIAVNANVSVGWWGQTLVKDRDLKFWHQVLDANREFANK